MQESATRVTRVPTFAALTQARSPYVVGKQISFWLHGTEHVEATVVEVKTFTLSCVLFVRPQHEGLPKYCALKVYDRRFATQLREDEDAGRWTAEIERQYRDSVMTGEADDLFHTWSQKSREDKHWKVEDEYWKCRELEGVELETYLQFLAWNTYKIETHAYDLMKDLQGFSIPKFFGHVRLAPLAPSKLDSSSERLIACPGILLELMKGFPLTDLADHAPKGLWPSICEEAMRIVRQIGERGICNRDVNTRSFIVTQQQGSPSYSVSMIDFGLCDFRDQAKTDEEFEAWQADEEEEESVGCVMQKKLQGAYVYKRSARADHLAAKYKNEAVLQWLKPKP